MARRDRQHYERQSEDERKRRAQQAQGLLEHPLLREILDGKRDEALAAFKRSHAGDDEKRKDAWMAMQVVDLIEQELQSIVQTAKIDEARSTASRE